MQSASIDPLTNQATSAMFAIPDRRQLSWAMYDWANSAFAVTVMAGFFPLFFKQYWSQDTAVTTSTFYLGVGNSVASLIIVLLAPLLGAIADTGGMRRRMLASFACAGILATVGFFFVQAGMWPVAIALYTIGIIGFSGANVFYDSMLLLVASEERRHRISALGFAMGYLGGGLLFLVNVIMTLKPELFGLADISQAVRWSFVTVGIWWAIFTVPILLFVDEPDKPETRKPINFKKAFTDIVTTARNVRQHRNVALFLLAYWLYIDGVATIIRMAVDYGLSIGIDSNSLITALLIVQFIGFPATLFFGRLAERIGARKGLWIGLWAYVLATIYAGFMTSSTEFYALAVVLGLVQGGVQSLSRSLFSQLIPPEKGGEFFGFLNMMSKGAAVVGPIMVGVVAYISKDSRIGILSILLLFFAGMYVLRFVKEPTIAQDR